MPEIMMMLFDHYASRLEITQGKESSPQAKARYQQLIGLVGEHEAIDIWDIAVAEGSILQEECFLAGLKAGLALAGELADL